MLLIWMGICFLASLGQPTDATTEDSPVAAINEDIALAPDGKATDALRIRSQEQPQAR